MQCPKCKREIPDDAVLCCYCGKRIAMPERKAKKRPNHSGTVYKVSGRRSRPWAAARDKVFLGYFPTKAEAQAELDRTARRSLTEAYNLTLADIHARWKEERYPELAPKSIEAYDLAWALFGPVAGRKMRELRTEDIQKLVDAQVKKGRSRSQTEKIRSLYSQLCKFSMREDIIDKNYASFLRLPKTAAKERHVLTAEDLALLKEDAPACETSRIILILCYTGFRINELLQLPLSGVHMEMQCFVGGEKTAAGKNRIIPFHPEIVEHVSYFYALADKSSEDARYLNGYKGDLDAHNFRNRQFYPTLERLGIRTADRQLTPHVCRYTFATMGAKAGIAQEALQKLMGHAQFSTTANIYIQDDLDMLRSELAKMI